MNFNFEENVFDIDTSLDFASEMLTMDESIEGIFHRYVLTKNNEIDNVVYCFFEGIDDYRYYCSRINKHTSKEVVNYDCKGKNNVLLLHGMIKNQTSDFDKYELLYFIDKDFDIESNVHNDIYVTPCYSIENLYVTDTAFCEFIKGELGISRFSQLDDKEDFNNVLNFFKEERERFIERVTILNAWYSLQKNNSHKRDKKNKPNLSAIKSAYTKNMKGEINIEKLKRMTTNYIELNEIEIQTEKNRLMIDPISRFRGKYYEEFLQKTLSIIITDANDPKSIFNKKRNNNVVLGRDNLISVLSQYADTPACLDEYLNSRLNGKYILENAN